MRIVIAIVAAALAVALSGCGGGEKKEKPAVPAEVPSTNPPVEPAELEAPRELLGTYTVRLEKGDLPSDAAEALTDGGEDWTVQLAETGGPGDGPAITISNDELGPLETSNFEAKGGKILIHKQECEATGEPVESEYGYKVDGSQLTLTEEKEGCPDKVASTILTTKPLKKKG